MGTVRHLADWMIQKHFEVVARCMRQNFDSWGDLYLKTVMWALGWRHPDTFEELETQWPKMLRSLFKIKVRVVPLKLGVNPR